MRTPLRIVNLNGFNATLTTITDADGKPLKGVRKITIVIEVDKPISATVEFIAAEIDVTAPEVLQP